MLQVRNNAENTIGWNEFFKSFLIIKVMSSQPYTYKQASLAAGSFQYLKGKPYDKAFSDTTPILDVVIAPFSETGQWEFMERYERTGNADISNQNLQEGYDVIVIARYLHDAEIYLWMDVATFVQNNATLPAKRAAEKKQEVRRFSKEIAA